MEEGVKRETCRERFREMEGKSEKREIERHKGRERKREGDDQMLSLFDEDIVI